MSNISMRDREGKGKVKYKVKLEDFVERLKKEIELKKIATKHHILFSSIQLLLHCIPNYLLASLLLWNENENILQVF